MTVTAGSTTLPQIYKQTGVSFYDALGQINNFSEYVEQIKPQTQFEQHYAMPRQYLVLSSLFIAIITIYVIVLGLVSILQIIKRHHQSVVLAQHQNQALDKNGRKIIPEEDTDAEGKSSSSNKIINPFLMYPEAILHKQIANIPPPSFRKRFRKRLNIIKCQSNKSNNPDSRTAQKQKPPSSSSTQGTSNLQKHQLQPQSEPYNFHNLRVSLQLIQPFLAPVIISFTMFKGDIAILVLVILTVLVYFLFNVMLLQKRIKTNNKRIFQMIFVLPMIAVVCLAFLNMLFLPEIMHQTQI